MAKHLFVMDPMTDLNLELDTSLRIAAALDRRGEACYHVTPSELAWDRDDAAAKARCRRLLFVNGPDMATADEGDLNIGLEEFATIHMRKDPPFDMNYIMTTWLLETAQRHARLYNHPSALRGLNEKLAIFHFKKASAEGLVSSDPYELLTFIEEKANGDAILKPLDLFGGRGVTRLETKDRNAALKTLKDETQNGMQMRLVQPFDKAIYEGEVRVFTAFGTPVSWCLKRPAEGDYMANTRMGATLEAYMPSPELEERITEIAEALMMDGVVFIGFDVIGGLVSEINITSPRLLVAPGEPETAYDDVANLIMEDVSREF